MTKRPAWLLGATVALTLVPGLSRADPEAHRAVTGDDHGSGDQRAAAQVLFDRAQALVEQGRFAEACPQFAESERLDPAIGTQLWLADCYENTGQTAAAWSAFEHAATMAASRHDARESVARDRAARLEARLSRLLIVVSPAAADTPGLQIHCDGMPIESAQWSQALSLDPGSHTITASAENRQVWWTTVRLAPGASATSVSIPELAALPIAAPASLAEGAPVDGAQTGAAERRRTNQRIGGVVLAAGGVIGLVVGSVFSLNAKARYDDSNSSCLPDNECYPIGQQDRSEARSMATVATVAMGLGAAAVAGGAILYFTAPRAGAVALGAGPVDRGGAIRLKMIW